MEAIKANTEARRVLDAALVHAALEFYKRHLSPDIKIKAVADLDRLILEYDTVAKTPLTYDDDGCLIVAPDDDLKGPEQKVNLNDL